ncbi:unnamed protein product [Haemonchus placei]|uniref:Uncharacterized protein n=1 Tax=Haemonchus placei TaxID=6290 RepID=A0A0N4WLI1_HAEPC|nr:unnamed protein product [Haemonchus placei]
MEEPHEEQHSKEMTGSHEKVAGVTPSGEGVAGVTPSGERVAQADGEQQARPTESKEGVVGPVESNERLEVIIHLNSISPMPSPFIESIPHREHGVLARHVFAKYFGGRDR